LCALVRLTRLVCVSQCIYHHHSHHSHHTHTHTHLTLLSSHTHTHTQTHTLLCSHHTHTHTLLCSHHTHTHTHTHTLPPSSGYVKHYLSVNVLRGLNGHIHHHTPSPQLCPDRSLTWKPQRWQNCRGKKINRDGRHISLTHTHTHTHI